MTARGVTFSTLHEDGPVPTIVDLAPAAAPDEREAADLYGLRFDGHGPLRPLVAHDLDLRHWTVLLHARSSPRSPSVRGA